LITGEFHPIPVNALIGIARASIRLVYKGEVVVRNYSVVGRMSMDRSSDDVAKV